MLPHKGKIILNFRSLEKFKYLYKNCITVMLVQQQDKTTTEGQASVIQLMLRHWSHTEFFIINVKSTLKISHHLHTILLKEGN